MTLERHLELNRENIEREAEGFAKRQGISIEKARDEMIEAYTEGYYEGLEAERYE